MRVLVTRPEADAARTAAALTTRGHVAVLAPVTAVRRTGATLPTGRFAAIAATSHHAFGEDAPALNRASPVFAVGRRTAEAARAAGFRDVRIGTGDAAGLADLVRLTLPPGGRLLYLAGRDRKPALEAALAAAGHAVDAVEVYAAEPVARWPAAVVDGLGAGDIDAALHYSHRSADLALALAGQDGLDGVVLALRHACLSTDAAAPLLARGAAAVAVAARPEEDDLLVLLASPTAGPTGR